MDPLIAATLATHYRPDLRWRRHRARAGRLAAWLQDHDELAWSALPHSPVIPEPSPGAPAARWRLGAALRGFADRVDGRRPGAPLPGAGS
jgi:hypothetical protein